MFPANRTAYQSSVSSHLLPNAARSMFCSWSHHSVFVLSQRAAGMCASRSPRRWRRGESKRRKASEAAPRLVAAVAASAARPPTGWGVCAVFRVRRRKAASRRADGMRRSVRFRQQSVLALPTATASRSSCSGTHLARTRRAVFCRARCTLAPIWWDIYCPRLPGLILLLVVVLSRLVLVFPGALVLHFRTVACVRF